MSFASSATPEPEPFSGSVPIRSAPALADQNIGSIAPKPVNRAHRQYQQAQIETASPTRLIVLLYDGAIRFCSLALEAMQARNLEVQNTNLIKAQRILAELMGSLNREAGGEVAENLFRVYSHMLEQLVTGNLHDEPKPVESVLTMLRELRETWAEVDRMATQSGGSGGTTATLGDRLV
jgi:flagellar secretion chaperone FliS